MNIYKKYKIKYYNTVGEWVDYRIFDISVVFDTFYDAYRWFRILDHHPSLRIYAYVFIDDVDLLSYVCNERIK